MTQSLPLSTATAKATAEPDGSQQQFFPYCLNCSKTIIYKVEAKAENGDRIEVTPKSLPFTHRDALPVQLLGKLHELWN